MVYILHKFVGRAVHPEPSTDPRSDTVKTLFVMWLWMAHPWQFGPVPMTPGWYATRNIFESAEACLLQAQTLSEGGKRHLVCVVAGKAPNEGPIARLRR